MQDVPDVHNIVLGMARHGAPCIVKPRGETVRGVGVAGIGRNVVYNGLWVPRYYVFVNRMSGNGV